MTALEGFYNSAYQQPLLLGAPTLAWIGYLLSRRAPRDYVWRYCVMFAALSLLDAWLTANIVLGYGALSGAMATAIPIFFVILGDFRVYAWLFRGQWARVVAFSLIVPVLSQIVTKFLPAAWNAEPRTAFLVYEILFVVAFGIVSAAFGKLNRYAVYALTYYALWIVADIALVATAGASATAWCLRITANLMYYVGWTIWVYHKHPSRSGNIAI